MGSDVSLAAPAAGHRAPALASPTSTPRTTPLGGHEDWVVACSCGTRDDDGERMLSCDACARWHHWRCAGLGEADPDPTAWQCPSCAPAARKEAG